MITQMSFKVEEDLKLQFSTAAKNFGKSNSQILRELVESFVFRQSIEKDFDELWNLVGLNLKANNIKQEDISKMIKEVRKSKK